MAIDPAELRAVREPSGWQAQKSAATRALVVEAAVRCFAELGYARTTMAAIADRAGLSRGAMLHHFPAKLDIVRGAVEYLHARRLAALRRALRKAPQADGDRVRGTVAAYWTQIRHPLSVAFLELSVAARTDRELAAILLPAQAAFEREWHRVMAEAFPGVRGRPGQLGTALDLARRALEGLAIALLAREETEHDRHLLRCLDDRLGALLGTSPGADLRPPHVPPESPLS